MSFTCACQGAYTPAVSGSQMRHIIQVLLFVLAFAPAAAFADDPLAAAILNLEAENVDAELADTLTSIVRNEALQVDKYQVVNKFPIRLSDIALLVGCSVESPSCLKQVANEVEARVLIHGLVRKQGEKTYQIEINIYDVANAQMINRLTKTLPDTSDPVGGFRKEIESFFAEERGVTETRLQVGASVDGAQVRIDAVYVGVAPLERKGLAPGTYAIQVAHPDYQVWETRVELGAGDDQRVWAQLVPVAAQSPAVLVEPDAPTTVVVEERPAPPPRERRVNWGAWSALGVGALSLGTAVGFGIALEGVEQKVEDEAAAGSLTEARYQELFDRGKNLELAHRILLGVGVVGAATGVIWLVADGMGEKRAELGVSPSGVAVRWHW